MQAVPSGYNVWQLLPLQPYWQVVEPPATQTPESLQVVAYVSVFPLHVWALPQDVPLPLLPAFKHTERPVAHDVLPISHMLPVLQLWFGVQAPHVPALQYMFAPHDWPLLLAVIVQVPPVPEQS